MKHRAALAAVEDKVLHKQRHLQRDDLQSLFRDSTRTAIITIVTIVVADFRSAVIIREPKIVSKRRVQPGNDKQTTITIIKLKYLSSLAGLLDPTTDIDNYIARKSKRSGHRSSSKTAQPEPPRKHPQHALPRQKQSLKIEPFKHKNPKLPTQRKKQYKS